jgi:thymidylate kinase
MDKKGCLIVFEGTPGAGKTSVVQWLARKTFADIIPELDHHAEPSGERGHGSFAWYLRQERSRQPLVRPMLEAGKAVLQDRWYFSTLAFAFARASLAAREAQYYRQRVAAQRVMDSSPFQPALVVRMTVDHDVSVKRRCEFMTDARYGVWFDRRFLRAYEHFYETELITLVRCPLVQLDSTGLGILATAEAAFDIVRSALGVSIQWG